MSPIPLYRFSSHDLFPKKRVDCAARQDVPNRQRKRKRRPERAAEPGSPLPYRESSGALRALQDAALGAEVRSTILGGCFGVLG